TVFRQREGGVETQIDGAGGRLESRVREDLVRLRTSQRFRLIDGRHEGISPWNRVESQLPCRSMRACDPGRRHAARRREAGGGRRVGVPCRSVGTGGYAVCADAVTPQRGACALRWHGACSSLGDVTRGWVRFQNTRRAQGILLKEIAMSLTI